MSSRQVTCAVMFVDISGSTRLYETVGDESALARVGHALGILSKACADCGGTVVKTAGDGAMCKFETADAALRASRLMQERIAQQTGSGAGGVGIHVGCHYGAALESGGDLFGDSVNLAARMAGLAKDGQIITTADTVAQLSPALGERVRRLEGVSVKGKRDAVAIFEFLWQDSEDLTAMGTRVDLGLAVRLDLSYEGREWHFDGPGELTFGRDGACNVTVGDRKASRLHARVERRREKFVLIDQSSNGTWVQFAGETDIVVLRREELILRASGLIGLGHNPTDGQGAPVRFACK